MPTAEPREYERCTAEPIHVFTRWHWVPNRDRISHTDGCSSKVGGPTVPSWIVLRVPPDCEGLQPRFRGCWIDLAETIAKRGCTPLFSSEDTFNSVLISMSFVSKSGPVSVECRFQPRHRIDEKHGVFDVVFLPKFVEKLLGGCCCSCRNVPQMEKFVRLGIDGGVQPELLTFDSDHGLVDRDAIRARATGGL